MSMRFLIGTGISLFVMAMGLSGTWAVMKHKTKENCKDIEANKKKIDAVENSVIEINTIINERLPKDLPKTLGRIEQQLKQLNSK